MKSWLRGQSDPSLSRLDAVADVLGLDGAHDLLLTLDEIKAKYGEDGERLAPFLFGRRVSTRSQSLASGTSSQSASAAGAVDQLERGQTAFKDRYGVSRVIDLREHGFTFDTARAS